MSGTRIPGPDAETVLAEHATPVSRRPRTSDGLRVALVCMPFYAADRPSIQIGLLAAIARQAGFPTDTYHLNVELAARLPDSYDGLCSLRGHMTGEWLFSLTAFGDDVDADDDAYYRAFPEEVAWVTRCGKDAAWLSNLRHEVLPRFVDDCLALTDWSQYEVIGFTSTFQQNAATLALARRIKARWPDVIVVVGGANMEDEMGPEYVRAFPFVDYVVVGEGDRVFPQLLEALAEGTSPEALTGVAMRDGDGVHFLGQAAPVKGLDDLPVPDYGEYFERVERLGLLRNPQYARMVPVESSRGCWWGEKHHCAFCGLNGLGMAYRSKSPERLLSELSTLTRRHRINFFETTDNILDMRYVRDLFPKIEATRTDYQFFYEVKSNLSRQALRTLYRGGVRWIQPGIESMSTHVLQLMGKGCTMLQNVRLLKWARYYRIRVGWNLLFGFPGETREDFEQELALLQLITHLEPPNWCGRIWMERFAPYFVGCDHVPIRGLRPEASYAHVYPDDVDLDKIAYIFDYTMDDTIPDEDHGATQAWVEAWQSHWESDTPDSLVYRRSMDALHIDDNRGPERLGSYAFYGPMATIYEYCSETMRTVPQITRHLGEAGAESRFADEEVRAALDLFLKPGLMIAEDGQYLSLALPVNPNW